MSELRRRRGVDDDIFEQAAFLADRSPAVAERFVDSVQRTLKDLAGIPGAGSRKDFGMRALAEVRTWRVRGFPNHLIYYIPLDDGIDVLAVLHGAREPKRILGKRARSGRRQ